MKSIDRLIIKAKKVKPKFNKIKGLTNEQLALRINELRQLLGISEEQAKDTNWLKSRIRQIQGEINENDRQINY